MIEVLRPGTSTTVQDLGRPGLGAAGVPASGAMDPFAARAANLLVGNDEDAATLEITLHGPALRFAAPAVVALAGARVRATLDDAEMPHETAVPVAAGQTLGIERTLDGARSILAVRGGIDVPVVLGSRSTHLPSGIGGMQGRALRAGDVLPVGVAPDEAPVRRLLPGALPRPGSPCVLRALPGPQEDAFAGDAVERFFSEPFTVSTRADRAGIRLDGEPLRHRDGADLAPEGLAPGSVQVPGDGRPILLGPDRPATGGYAKIATVATADVGLLAWLRPGDTLRFVRITVEEARAAWAARERALRDGVEELG